MRQASLSLSTANKHASRHYEDMALGLYQLGEVRRWEEGGTEAPSTRLAFS